VARRLSAHIGRAACTTIHKRLNPNSVSAVYRLHSVEVIAKQNTDSEQHFVDDCRNVPVAPFPELATRVMSDAELYAPESNGPSAHSEHRGDVLLQYAGSFQSAEKLLVRTPVYATRNIVFLAPSVDRVSGDATNRCNCRDR
jgi:hypothetical protein